MGVRKSFIGAGLALFALWQGGVQAQTGSNLAPSSIDSMIQAAWKKEGVTPTAPADDARFLRRLYLDVLGTIPPAQVVSDFLTDKSLDRRARAIESVLDSPRYADNWTNYWNRVLMAGRVENPRFVDRGAFQNWLYQEFDNNTHWNKFAYDLITASGQNSAGGANAKRMSVAKNTAMTDPDSGNKINGAVNWVLKYQGKPEDLSGNASKIFLGVQIQCAQCHDHKTEKWKQEDFKKFTACFVNTRPKPLVADRTMKDYRVELMDVARPFVRKGKKKPDSTATYANSVPSALDGTDFSGSGNRRQALASWMTAPENPWFAETFVNRMWSHFLGRGFIEPIDDIRPSNPVVMPELLKKLSDDFVAHDYDVKRLIKTICSTQVYQLSSAGKAKTDEDNTLWAKFRLKAMGPEETLDSLITATSLQPVLEKQFGANVEQMKARVNQQFSFLFDVDEEFEQKEFEGTIPQALMLLNGALTNKSTTPIPGTTLAEVMAMPGEDASKIEALYLRTFSRKPTATETKNWTEFVNAPREVFADTSAPLTPMQRRQQAQAMKPGANKGKKMSGGPDVFNALNQRGRSLGATPKLQAYEDMFWALLNSSEFTFNH